jgi:hypothetical protein
VVTICTICFNTAHRVRSHVSCKHHNKQQSLHWTALTGWSL